MRRIMEHCDGTVMEHSDDKNSGACDANAMENCDDMVMEHCDDKNSGALC